MVNTHLEQLVLEQKKESFYLSGNFETPPNNTLITEKRENPQITALINNDLNKQREEPKLQPTTNKLTSQKLDLLNKVNEINRFLADRLSSGIMPMKKPGRWLYEKVTRMYEKHFEISSGNRLFPEPERTAKILTQSESIDTKDIQNLIRSSFGTISAILTFRGINREILNIFSEENRDSILSALGANIFKMVGVFYTAKDNSEIAPWRTQVHRLEASTAYYPIALNSRKTLETKDMTANTVGTLKAIGLGVNAVTINCNMTNSSGENNRISSTAILHHQIDGQPAISLANKISTENEPTDDIEEIARIILQTEKVLSNTDEVNELLGERKFRGIDYYETNSEYGLPMLPVENKNISLCIDGYELILPIQNENGQVKSKETIMSDIKTELEIAKQAVLLRNLYNKKLSLCESKKEREQALRQIQRRGFMAAYLDLRSSTASSKLIENTKLIATELKKQKNNRESQFDKLSKCLFRIHINTKKVKTNLPDETENIEEHITKVGNQYKRLTKSLGRKTKELYPIQGEELYQERWNGKNLSAILENRRKLTEQATIDQIETVDITEKFNTLKTQIRTYLKNNYQSSEPIDETLVEIYIKILCGNAKLIELLEYANGSHPVNCVSAKDPKQGLQITNSFAENDALLTNLRQQYDYLSKKYNNKGESLDPNIISAFRISATKSLQQISESMKKAQKGETINGTLIEVTRKAGELFAEQPRIIQSIIKSTFVTFGRILPPFRSPEAQKLIDQLKKIDLRKSRNVINAEVQMFLTHMIFPIKNLSEDITGNMTISVPKGTRKGAGIGATAATNIQSDMLMINAIDDRIIATVRGSNVPKAKQNLIESIEILSQIFSEKVLLAF